jgi:predicted DsbA family dithiol-disulfide isomerase
MQSGALRVDVWFDLICPWCLIGKRQLQTALRRLAEEQPGVAVDLHWHGAQLIRDVPPEGWPFAAFYERRLGSPQAVRDRQAQVRAAAEQAGAVVDFERITTFPNTARAHQLLNAARPQLSASDFDALLERLLAAYFWRGEDLGDMSTLLAIAQAHGLSTDALDPALDQPLPPASAVPSVPFFIFNQRLALSGAQPADTLLRAIREAQLQVA